MDYPTVAVVLATFIGPIAAVLVTRFVDSERDKHQRRLTIFRTLMATRAVGLNPDRISALNMIQIDFAQHPKVLSAWTDLLKNFLLPEVHAEGDVAAMIRDRNNLSTRLLAEMAKVLKIKIDQLDILDGVYYPRGLVAMESEQEAIRKLFADIAAGKRALPILAYVQPAEAQQLSPEKQGADASRGKG